MSEDDLKWEQTKANKTFIESYTFDDVKIQVKRNNITDEKVDAIGTTITS